MLFLCQKAELRQHSFGREVAFQTESWLAASQTPDACVQPQASAWWSRQVVPWALVGYLKRSVLVTGRPSCLLLGSREVCKCLPDQEAAVE